MWPAQRRVVESVRAARDGGRAHDDPASDSREDFVPDYGGSTESEGEDEPEGDSQSSSVRVVRME
eukprot:5020117-Alexandrium_andersonii.AAC.1